MWKMVKEIIHKVDIWKYNDRHLEVQIKILRWKLKYLGWKLNKIKMRLGTLGKNKKKTASEFQAAEIN